MPRSKGSYSSNETKSIAEELEQLQKSPYKYNLDYLRLVEMLISYRISEKVCSYNEEEPVQNKIVTAEIPLIGELTITPSVFHEKHRLTDEPSIHFSFDFKPSSSFKADLVKIYSNKVPNLTNCFAKLYSEKLNELYNKYKDTI